MNAVEVTEDDESKEVILIVPSGGAPLHVPLDVKAAAKLVDDLIASVLHLGGDIRFRKK